MLPLPSAFVSTDLITYGLRITYGQDAMRIHQFHEYCVGPRVADPRQMEDARWGVELLQSMSPVKRRCRI